MGQVCVVGQVCYLQMTQSRALGLMCRAVLTNGLLRYRVEGVELVQGGSRRTDRCEDARPRNFCSEREENLVIRPSLR